MTLLAFILFYVQSSAVLHAVVHPFHADHKYDNHEEHAIAHSFQSHPPHSQQHSDYDENIACDAFFAGERLTKYATLYKPPSIPTASFTRIHYCALSPLILTQHKTRPRARSPPLVFS